MKSIKDLKKFSQHNVKISLKNGYIFCGKITYCSSEENNFINLDDRKDGVVMIDVGSISTLVEVE